MVDNRDIGRVTYRILPKIDGGGKLASKPVEGGRFCHNRLKVGPKKVGVGRLTPKQVGGCPQKLVAQNMWEMGG